MHIPKQQQQYSLVLPDYSIRDFVSNFLAKKKKRKMIKERKNQNGANRAYKDLKIMPRLYLANPTKSISLPIRC